MGSAVKEAGDSGGERERKNRGMQRAAVWWESGAAGEGDLGSTPLGGGSCGTAKSPVNAHGHAGEGLLVSRILRAGPVLLRGARMWHSLLAGKVLRSRGGC